MYFSLIKKVANIHLPMEQNN